MRKRDTEGRACWRPFCKNGAWHIDFYVEGERFRRSTGVCDPEAFEIACKVAKGIHDAAWDRALSPFPTFAEAAEVYLAEFDKNREHVKRLVEYFGPFVRIDEIDPFTIKQCKVDLSKPGWADATSQRQIIVPLKAIINNAFGMRPVKVVDNVRTRILTPEEFERLIVVANDPPKTMRDRHRRLLKIIAFLIGSGATPGEMFCVRVEDLHCETGEVWIRGNELGGGKTEYRPRMVQLPARAWALMGELPSDGRAFRTTTGLEVVPDGKRGSKVINQLHKLCDAAGLSMPGEDERIVFYSLRHSWATWFSAQVGDHDLLIDRGGWAKADTARRYRKRPPADLADRLLARGWDFRP